MKTGQNKPIVLILKEHYTSAGKDWDIFMNMAY